MKRHKKITLASLAVILGILTGVLTVVEKSINIVNGFKVKTQASKVPDNVIVEKGLAIGIERDENKIVAKMSK